MNNKTKSNIMLFLCAFIWGGAFVAQSAGMDYIGPWTFICLRYLVGGLTLVVLIPFIDKLRGRDGKETKTEKIAERKVLLMGGIACGCALCAGGVLQQFGIQTTSVGKAGFLTALYTIIVPILGLFIGKKTRPLVWGCVVLSCIGFYFLSISGSVSIESGDLRVLLGSVMFAVHILVIDYFSPLTDGVRMSCIQFFVAAAIAFVPMIVFEHPSLANIFAAGAPILYAGVLSSGIAYTLQILGQRGAEPAVASMILSLEAVFAAIFGFLFLHEVLSLREFFGCALIFAAILLAQLPEQRGGVIG